MYFKRLIIVYLIFSEYSTMYHAKYFLLVISRNFPTALWGEYCYYLCFNHENLRLLSGGGHTICKWQSWDSNSVTFHNVAFPSKSLVRWIIEWARNYKVLNKGSHSQYGWGKQRWGLFQKLYPIGLWWQIEWERKGEKWLVPQAEMLSTSVFFCF